MNQPPLKFLHAESSLIELKLKNFRQVSTEDLIKSLEPDTAGALETKADGTIMDGHHHIKILRERGVDVDKLPREIWRRIR